MTDKGITTRSKKSYLSSARARPVTRSIVKSEEHLESSQSMKKLTKKELIEKFNEQDILIITLRLKLEKMQKTIDSCQEKEKELSYNYDCMICYENLKEKHPTSTHCGHIFCAQCCNDIVITSKKCPVCQSYVDSNKIHRIYFP